MRIDYTPHHGGRKHGHRGTHHRHSTRPLRTEEGPLSDLRPARPPQRMLPPRRVRTVAYKAVAYLEITCGEYRAGCGCCTTFRSTPEGVLPRASYDNTTTLASISTVTSMTNILLVSPT